MTKTTIENRHCDTCSNGIVMVKETKAGLRISLKFYDCNVCKKPFGLLRFGKLKVVNNVNESDQKSRSNETETNSRTIEVLE